MRFCLEVGPIEVGLENAGGTHSVGISANSPSKIKDFWVNEVRNCRLESSDAAVAPFHRERTTNPCIFLLPQPF
jgi:hypothetical protein